MTTYRRSPSLPRLGPWLISLLFTAAAPGLPAAEARSRPNVVLVMADDLGWGDVAYHGNPKVRTPALDQLARDGVRLDRFYATPVCTPTRGSCLTGRNPNRYGATWAGRYPLPRKETTIAEVLGAAGYRTGFFGKWHLGKLTPERDEGFPAAAPPPPAAYSPPWQHGFEVCFATESAMPNYNPLVWDDDWNLQSTSRAANKYIMDRPLQYGEGTLIGKPLPRWPYHFWLGENRRAPGPLAGDASELIMDPALDFIGASVAQQRPFLAVVWFVTPHTPVAAGPEARAAYATLPMREQHWFGAISAMDAQIGRLRHRLRALGVERDTLLWFCSDNGPSWVHELNSAGPLRGQKADVFEGGIRTASIVHWPAGLAGGRVVDQPVSVLDFLPTLAAAAGVAPNLPRLDGENVLPLLQGTAPARRGPLFFDYPRREGAETWAPGETRQMAVIDGDWKLVSLDGERTFQLYDLARDIGERTDQSAANGAIIARLRAAFDRWAESCAASLNGADYVR